MHGCSSGSALLVNAEVDSMGGVVDGGGDIGTKPSPRRAAIKKAQAELRQEYDVLEERRRQLEFLEKGGNPLDFKIGNAASVSVQSTSQTDQHPEQFVTSEAKGSFALTASPHGDSVESSGRPGGVPSVCEPNSADNLMLFDGENEVREGERNSVHPSRSNIALSEQSSQLGGGQNAKESGDSAFGLPKKAYKRRNRSRPNRDGARSSSTDFVSYRGGNASSLPSRHPPRDAKGLVFVADKQKDRNVSSNSNSKPTSPNGNIVRKTVLSDSRLDMALDSARAVESTTGPTKGGLPDADASKNLRDKQNNLRSHSDAQDTPVVMASGEPESFGGREKVVLAGCECLPRVDTKAENQAISGQMNGFGSTKGGRKSIQSEGQNNSAVFSTKGLDSESSCTRTSLSLDENNDSEMCTNLKHIDSNGNTKEQPSMYEETPVIEGDELVKEKSEAKTDDICASTNNNCKSVHQFHQENGSVLKTEEELKGSGLGLQNEVKGPITIEGMEPHCITASETERKPTNLLGSNSTLQDENVCTGTLPVSLDSSIQELPENTLSIKGCTVSPERQICSQINLKLASKAREDTILEEARIIEAKRKRIAELSVGSLPSENRPKSHWDFVLEEMAWLANDFAQERLWKITAAAQICRRVAFTSRLRFQEQNSHWKQKEVAHSLAKAVMEFWHSVEDKSKELELQHPEKGFALAVQGYAVRFLKYNSSHVQHGPAEAPLTPEKISDLGILDMSWEEHLTEENLFYTVSPGATEAYRKSIEFHLLQCEKIGSSLQEEVETSGYDAVADFGSQKNAFEEDEGETSTYYLPGAFEGSKSSKFAQKKRKNPTKAHASRLYEAGGDLAFMQCMDNKLGTQHSVLIGKRSANSLNVSFPTKKVRTASRQRVVSPFSAGTSGCLQAPTKTDASSGDTNSFQDDLSTLHGGSHIPNSLEVDSLGDFEKQLRFDSTEVSNKPKNKRKAKHLGSTFEQRWQLDSNFHNEQRDHSKKRLESHQLESNGSSGLFGQHVMKKPKMMRRSLDNSFDNPNPMAGSVPSPVASQMSNMSNRNKFIKMLGGRDRGRKAKALKMSAGQSGPGSPWSLFEDQALVVLVHDMGPNWELVSDAMNSTLQFKCIFRKPKECNERHKVLMEGTAGDGADSAEDSGSSQPYPSTLPGIPKGSARQLFQRLQGPMEEDTLKSHFEKIIIIGQKQHYRMTQNDNQEPKQLQKPHSSHTLALSQVCPNNLNGGPILTPLDLCDATASSPDVRSISYQGPHTSVLPSSNQGTVVPMLPASGVNSSVQGSSSVVLGSNFSSPSGPLNAPIRDGRYGIPRTTTLTTDEQQRLQQYNQMLSGRNIQQSSLPVPGAIPGTDRGVRMLPAGNGMGIMSGLSRSMPMARPGFQGIAASSMLNSGSMNSGMVAMPSPVNMHSGASPSQGNSMLRPRDALHMMRPSQNPEHQRQMMVPEHQMQVSQGNSQGISPFNGLSSPFSNQTSPPPVQSYPLHHQQPHSMSPQQSHVLTNSHHPHQPNHATNTQQQAYAIHFAKERHLQQQRLMQQHQQQFSSSNALMPHVQAQSQVSISSPQNCPQIQLKIPSPSPLTASSSMTQHPQKHHMPPHGLGRNLQTGGSGLPNQMGKQRRQPQQQFQQPGRNHPPQQRQQSQSQQQAKLLKGGGRGNMMMHQNNLPIDPSLLNGLSTSPGSQSAEKGDQQVMHLMQGQGGFYSGSAVNAVQPSKQLVPPHSSNQSQAQQNMYSAQTPTSSKQLQQMPSHSDNSSQNHVPQVTSDPTLSTSHQAIPPPVVASSHHQQPQAQPHLKLLNQSQPAVQRVLQHNRQVNSDLPSKVQAREAQAEQLPVNKSSQMRTTASMPQACIDATNVTPVVSSASAPHWKSSEPLDSTGTPPLTNSAGGEPLPPVSQGLGRRQSSGSLPPVGHDGGVQWQQQPSQLQPPTPPPPVQQQQQSPQQQSQQQTQLVQAGKNSFMRSTNSRME